MLYKYINDNTIEGSTNKERFTFIDLFAGIGGFHIAMSNLGGKCVFASECDEDCRKTYIANFLIKSPDIFSGKDNFAGDITKVAPDSIPDHDVLCAGFPCQPFSQVGLRKGFQDARGSLFFNVAEIIKEKRPKAVFLENVRGLLQHRQGETFRVIKETILGLGYSFHYKIVRASDFNCPQHRPRLFIICFRNDIDDTCFEFPNPIPLTKNMNWVFDGKSVNREIGFTLRVGGRHSPLIDRRNWDGYIVDGKEVRVSPKEGKRMQGFPDSFLFPVSDSAAMRQLGNSVAIPAVQAVASEMINTIRRTRMNSFNRGEWSEIYAVISMLLNPELSIGDSELNEITHDLYYLKEILLNINNKDGLVRYALNNLKDVKVIYTDGVEDLVSKLELAYDKNKIIDAIRKAPVGGGAFRIEGIEDVLNKLTRGKGIKANSFSKNDLEALVKDNIQSKDVRLKYSIKSSLGSPATILNSSSRTNFLFSVSGLDAKYINEINSIDTHTKLQDRIRAIMAHGGKIKFEKICDDTLDYNLRMIDTLMPTYIANTLLQSYVATNKDLLSLFLKSNHFDDENFAKKKLGDFLEGISFGFFPSIKWDRTQNVNGGLVVVKHNGDIIILDLIYYKKEVVEYLMKETKLDSPSSTRYKMLELFIDDKNQICFTLNLQIRYKK